MKADQLSDILNQKLGCALPIYWLELASRGNSNTRERIELLDRFIVKFGKTRYIGLARVKAQALLVAIAHNLLKAANKIKVSEVFYRKVVSKNCFNGLFA